MDTSESSYAERLVKEQGRWWKRLLPVQLPYRANLRRQRLGMTLDIGCGLGRNLQHLPPGSLGVDHNAASVSKAREMGLDALTVAEFQASERSAVESFDSLLFAHVLEHMNRHEALSLVQAYLPYLKRGGTVFVICPQERGFKSDPTHIWFADDRALKELLLEAGLRPVSSYSFPLPRMAGPWFTYNEFCVRATR